ncbi:MAG: nucleotidyltransferase domain-containing protein [Thermomicrobiales bacterium]|nr:nucleotidyltransferase domain-containing protein [Thermomicrobiales bacterium]
MIDTVSDKQGEIAALCEDYDVIRLGLFGSAARDDFDQDTSDLDFLVLFDHREGIEYVRRYFDLAGALEKLFGRKIDLVTEKSVKKERFRQAIERDLVPVYVRPDRATAA